MKRIICAVMALGFIAMPVTGARAEEKNILKQGILGAATGAVVAKEADGKAGKGALIGAGTTVIGGALLDVIMPDQKTTTTTTTTQSPVYAPPVQQQASSSDYQKGYQDGFKAGYNEGINAQRPIVVPSRE